MTNKQKSERYKKALKMYMRDIDVHSCPTGMCYYIAHAFDLPSINSSSMIEAGVVELFKYKPEGASYLRFWWPLDEHQIRIEIFNEIIKSLEDE
jgi:hypothetical protein